MSTKDYPKQSTISLRFSNLFLRLRSYIAGYPRYIWAVILYMAVIIIAGTLATMYIGELSAVDSFYFVAQTMWTIGYGDVEPGGGSGMLLATAIILFGVVGITSALGVVGSMILNQHMGRHRLIEFEITSGKESVLEALYKWGNEKGISPEEIDMAIEEVRNNAQK